jgi:hypothetical protein
MASWVRIQFLSTGLCKPERYVGIHKGQNGILLVCVRFFIPLYILHGDVHLEEVEIREGSRRSRCLGPVCLSCQNVSTGLNLTDFVNSRCDRDKSMDFRGSTCQMKTPVTILVCTPPKLAIAYYLLRLVCIFKYRAWFCFFTLR